MQLRKIAPYFLVLGAAIGYIAWRTRRVPSPRFRWPRFEAPGTLPLEPLAHSLLEGMYKVEEGEELLGKSLVAKWSYTIEEGQTVYHLSFFCERQGSLVVCTGRRAGEAILLSGYWRQLSAGRTGTIVLQVHAGEDTRLEGAWGRGSRAPNQPISLRRRAALPKERDFSIIGHRGGGRTMDFFDTSENSLGMLLQAARLGATGVEIDVRLTRDDVPVVFHDAFLWGQTVRHSLYSGRVSKQTLAELQARELKKGGKIPTVREALETILCCTPLQTVWLDIKDEKALPQLRTLLLEYSQRAWTARRTLYLYLGLSTPELVRAFKQLEDHEYLPALTELEADEAEAMNAAVWAPQYTNGIAAEDVARLQAAGKKVFVWSLDTEFMVTTYIEEGGYDGIVTNAPPVVAFAYYSQALQQESA